ncbi:conserved domain protein, partial [Trichinella spiralis]|uniref:hypothetical protein n=1 Tax=Trichinella spiralis TaxID=6334 RepID=UPI0001EFE830
CQLAYCHCPAWLSQHPAPITVMRIAAVCCRRRRGDVRRRLGRKRKKLRPTQRGKNERRRRNWALITLHPFLKPLVRLCFACLPSALVVVFIRVEHVRFFRSVVEGSFVGCFTVFWELIAIMLIDRERTIGWRLIFKNSFSCAFLPLPSHY